MNIRERLITENNIAATESRLRKRFLDEATVTDPVKGYVSVPSVNQRIDLEMQGWAADMIAEHYKKAKIKFDAVVGIPNSGIPLATSVAERLGLPLAPGRKGKELPGAWRMPIVVDEDVTSFTTGIKSSFVFNGIRPGDRVLAVDDVIALGQTLIPIARAFSQRDISLDVSAYFSKNFQGGVIRLQEAGIEPFYAIGINSLSESNGNWRLQMQKPHFS